MTLQAGQRSLSQRPTTSRRSRQTGSAVSRWYNSRRRSEASSFRNPSQPRMKLLASHTSPYARKVRIAIAEKKIECELVEESPWAPGTSVPNYNPLGKVPVLALDDGTALYDSRVIVEYLHTVSPVSRLIPEPSRQRIAVKRWEALADGICDAAVAIVLETKRPAKEQSAESLARQRQKSDRGDKPWCSGDVYTLADIATGCALAYLDLRHPAIDWRGEYPSLLKLAEKLAKRQSFQDTVPTAALSPAPTAT